MFQKIAHRIQFLSVKIAANRRPNRLILFCYVIVLRIHCQGQAGHGSLLLDNTAGEKVRVILDKFYEFREQEKKKLDDDPNLNTGDVTSVNLTIVEVSLSSSNYYTANGFRILKRKVRLY